MLKLELNLNKDNKINVKLSTNSRQVKQLSFIMVSQDESNEYMLRRRDISDLDDLDRTNSV